MVGGEESIFRERPWLPEDKLSALAAESESGGRDQFLPDPMATAWLRLYNT